MGSGILGFVFYILTMFSIYGILSLSLNFQAGVAGMSNFGHIAFFAIGAYVSSLLVLLWNVHFLIGVLGATLAGAFFALIISMPTRRLEADYWAITTLGAAEIIRLFFLNEGWIGTGTYSGGAFGIRGIPRPWSGSISVDLYPMFYFGLSLVFLLFAYLIFDFLSKTPFGRVMRASREDPDLPSALGKNVFNSKVKTMVVGGGFAGLAGSLFAHYTTYIDPYFFMPQETFIVWAMVILGGRGNAKGAILGTFVIQLIYSSTRFLRDYIPLESQLLGNLRMVLIGIIIVLVMLFMQEGILKEKKHEYE
jgi:ABC-type branched-subunit amino acid transport system permease subunit